MKKYIGLFLLLPALTFAGAFVWATHSNTADSEEIEGLTLRYMEWERTIRLTPEQEAVKKAGLSAIPAACCSDNNAYTCCCPCNLSRAVWGLAAHMIVEEGANAEQVKTAASEWFERINPDGWSGDTCYTGGCGRPFAKNGCGGMSPSNVVFD